MTAVATRVPLKIYLDRRDVHVYEAGDHVSDGPCFWRRCLQGSFVEEQGTIAGTIVGLGVRWE